MLVSMKVHTRYIYLYIYNEIERRCKIENISSEIYVDYVDYIIEKYVDLNI